MSAEEEQARLLPVLEGILRRGPRRLFPWTPTRRRRRGRLLAAGAEIVNDVSGFAWDAEMAACVRGGGVRRGADAHAGAARGVGDAGQLARMTLIATVREGLEASSERGCGGGHCAEPIVLDPGYGFGKRFDENYALLARQAELLALGRPLLAGSAGSRFWARLAPLHGGQMRRWRRGRRPAWRRWRRQFCTAHRLCACTQ